MKYILGILAIFILWRIFLFLPLPFGYQYIPFPHGYHYDVLPYVLNPAQVTNPLLFPWANFDGIAYLRIAGDGYTYGNARFFPLYPMIVHGIFSVIGDGKTFGTVEFFVAFVTTNMLFLAALYMLFLLLRIDYNKHISLLSIVFLIIFPTSFFYGSVYTESLFLLLSVLSFYFARKKQWFLAGVCGGLLSATRLVGVFIFFALIYEYIITQKNSWKSLKILNIGIIPAGLVSFIVYNAIKFGNPLLFWQAQGQVANGRSVSGFVLFPQTMFRYIKIFLSVPIHQFEWWIALIEFSSFIFAGVCLYIAWKKKVRMSYLIFALFCYLLPASSGTFTGLPRYIAILFPMFLSIALTKNKWIYAIYVIVSIVLLFLLTLYFSRAYLIA